tara:strand:- start:1082 stop:3502 length:2421 start_codon:yes stop_codon:yes gene_type:complete
MKKSLKIGIKLFFSIFALIILVIVIQGYRIYSNLFGFENELYTKSINVEEMTENGFTFLDRNGNNKLDIYEDNRASIEDRLNDLSSQMNIEEKIHLLKGSGLKSALGMESGGVKGAVGTMVATPRLGIPRLFLSDGPAGVRISPIRDGEERTYYTTAFPIGTLLASTWNTELVSEVGNAMGNEALEYGIDVILGPGVNIHRNPLCGRNFEYYSEDPVLTGNIGAAIINGIQSNGIGTAPKHFVANNQETSRKSNNVIVSDRAMREIYLKGFEIIVKKSNPYTIMSSYNKVNGLYTSENKYLLTDILRNDWKYKGIVMTDWFGGNNPPEQIKAGNDLLEPGTNNQWKELKKAFENGFLSVDDINRAVKRILRLIIKSKKFEDYNYNNNPDLIKHAKITRKSASEGMVLLKNQDILPLKNVKNIALIGTTSYEFISGGTGSGDVEEAYTVSLEDGLKNYNFQINTIAKIAFETHRTKNKELFDKKNTPFPFSLLNPYKAPEMEYSINLLKKIAENSDIGIVTIGRNSGEFSDRLEKDDFLLSKKELEMIENTCQVFHDLDKKVIVVLNVGGVIETFSWRALPDAILLAWQGGQEGGNSVSDILTGNVNPSGKLPMTFPVNLSDHASTFNFPLDGKPPTLLELFSRGDSEVKPKEKQIKNEDYTIYQEGIYVGYRHFDKANLEVAYPFGYGLSYTDFKYDDLNVDKNNTEIKINLKITNTGGMAGKEVTQIYIGKEETEIDRPLIELKSFAKTPVLNIGEAFQVNLSVLISDLSYWDEVSDSWKIEKGKYKVYAGSSSRDIRLTSEIEL